MAKKTLHLDLLEQIVSEPNDRKVAEASLSALKGLVGGDYYSVLYCHLASRTIDSYQDGHGWLGTSHPLMQSVREKFSDHPLTQKFLSHHQSAAYLRSELVPDPLWQRDEIYNEVDRPLGIEDLAAIYLPTASGHVMILTCGRNQSFRAPEMEPIRKFQRVLNGLPPFRSAAQLPPGKTSPELDCLSAREREVLHWLRQGKRNAEIGMILSISSHTVHHHLEKIYFKLGVENRSAAMVMES